MNASARNNGDAYVLGIDMGTESVRAGIYDVNGKPLAMAARAYKTTHPHSGWAEQDPHEWWSALVYAVHQAMRQANLQAEQIVGICGDSTTCTVVALDATDKLLP